MSSLSMETLWYQKEGKKIHGNNPLCLYVASFADYCRLQFADLGIQKLSCREIRVHYNY